MVGEGEPMKAHFRAHLKEYTAFDEDCFARWADIMQPETREFLSNNVGVLFHFSGGESLPFCSAFRIAPNLIATAHHCIPGVQLVFRPLGHPEQEIKVIKEVKSVVARGDAAADLDDWAVYQIADTDLPYTWTPDVFAGDILPDNAVYIFSISEFAYFITEQGNPDKWRDAMRFSRVNGGKLWPVLDVGASLSKNPELVSRCLFDRIPTFAIMSGAAIMAIRRPEGDRPARRLIAGMHLRNGALLSDGDRSCGTQTGFNVGVRLAPEILAIATGKAQ